MPGELRARPRLIVSALMAVSVGGFAAAAQDNTTTAPVAGSAIAEQTSELFEAVELVDVTGGEEADPYWTSDVGTAAFRAALRDRLRRHAMLAGQGGRFALTTELIDVDQPFVGRALTVTSKAKYTVIDRTSGTVYLEAVVEAAHTANLSDALYAPERLRLANEGSVRSNINQFIRKMVARSSGVDEADVAILEPVAPGQAGAGGSGSGGSGQQVGSGVQRVAILDPKQDPLAPLQQYLATNRADFERKVAAFLRQQRKDLGLRLRSLSSAEAAEFENGVYEVKASGVIDWDIAPTWTSVRRFNVFLQRDGGEFQVVKCHVPY